MNTFHMYFNGLICHVGRDSQSADPRDKRFAAIINEPNHHYPLICFRKGEVAPQYEMIRLWNRDFIELLDGLTPGVARADRLFEDTVPSLKEITGGATIEPAIEEGRPDADVLAYLKYPKGDLTVSAWYPCKVIYVLNGSSVTKSRCVARIVHFAATTNAERVRIKITNGEKVRFDFTADANAHMCVQNATHMTGRGHLQYHRPLTNAPTIATVFESNQPCVPGGLPDCHCDHHAHGSQPAAGVDPECSNSGWP
ncbi:MAG TPA: hypothetical protein VNA69_11295 [Thermoanaerobaculia bacterium]|nr:hypothetical protein [Thermoanaerobaculia bacterium]